MLSNITTNSLHNLQGLYVITNDEPFEILIEKLSIIVTFPCVSLIQYRRKKVQPDEQLKEAQIIQSLCLEHDIHFIINDDIQLAKHLSKHGSCGVHLGQTDGEIADAQALLGNEAIIGRTCHNSLELAKHAEKAGASYVAFGALHASPTKPLANTVSTDMLARIKQHITIPACVIGGITADDFDLLKTFQIDLIAVISDVMSGDIDTVKNKMTTWQTKFDKSISS